MYVKIKKNLTQVFFNAVMAQISFAMVDLNRYKSSNASIISKNQVSSK